MLQPSKGLLVYTDGAWSNKGPGGWAWVAIDESGTSEDESGFVPPPTTNNRMEFQAQIEALNRLFERYGACEIEVVSDSSYIVLGCQHPSRARNVNLELWEALEQAANQHTWVQWRLIPGHSGIKWNEHVDKLAVDAKRNASWQDIGEQ